jgi:heavy metal sensor kinase
MNKLRQSLAFRLTLWYAAIFIIVAATAFTIIYILINKTFQERIDQDLLAQSREFESIYAIEGIEMLQRTAVMQIQTAGEKKMFFRLMYPSGVVFASSSMSYWRNVAIRRQAVEAVLGGIDPYFTTHMAPSGVPLRVIYTRMGSGIILQLGYLPESEARLLQTIKQVFLITLVALLILSVAVGWFMARRALSGVATLARTARQISKDDLESRVPVAGRHNEIDRLAVAFNNMLDRIQNLVTATRQMNDNIAHDLRSPIARIRGLAEVTLLNAQHKEEYAQMAASTIEECDRLLDMINTMLTISRTESGVSSIEREAVNFSELVQDACELFNPLAEDRQIKMECRLDENLIVPGDQHLLQRMVSNLLDNAIKYTDLQGSITVTLSGENHNQVNLSVADTGKGIPEADQQRIFDRFFRGDLSRTEDGAGLGLSLARAIAYAHQGSISVESKLNEGSTFTVSLPLS